jgi:hypothetical protein
MRGVVLVFWATAGKVASESSGSASPTAPMPEMSLFGMFYTSHITP